MGCKTSLSSLPLLPLLPLLDDEEAVEPDDDVELSPDAKRDLRERGGVFAASREKGDIVESFAPRGLCTGEMLSARCIFFTGVLHVMWHAGQFGLVQGGSSQLQEKAGQGLRNIKWRTLHPTS